MNSVNEIIRTKDDSSIEVGVLSTANKEHVHLWIEIKDDNTIGLSAVLNTQEVIDLIQALTLALKKD